eukprot:1153968-Pelagomonas_calceolata.AAC.1
MLLPQAAAPLAARPAWMQPEPWQATAATDEAGPMRRGCLSRCYKLNNVSRLVRVSDQEDGASERKKVASENWNLEDTYYLP